MRCTHEKRKMKTALTRRQKANTHKHTGPLTGAHERLLRACVCGFFLSGGPRRGIKSTYETLSVVCARRRRLRRRHRARTSSNLPCLCGARRER